MASFTTSFDSIMTTAALPDAVEISTSTTDEELQVSIIVNSATAATVDLYPFGGQVVLYDIRTIIEDVMLQNNLAFATCNVSVVDNNATTSAGSFTVIMSDIDIPNISTWLASHFLTTRTSQRISANGQQLVNWFSAQGESVNYKIEAIVDNGTTQVVSTWTERASQTVNKGVYYSLISVEGIIAHFEDEGQVRAFKVYRGANRTMEFYITEEEPNMLFKFKNNFNVEEYVGLYAATNRKQKLEASEANILRTMVKYDFNTITEYEVVSAMLTVEEAKWLSQMVTSREVHLKINASTWKEILIDGESEVSDLAGDENRLKFSYQFAKRVKHLI